MIEKVVAHSHLVNSGITNRCLSPGLTAAGIVISRSAEYMCYCVLVVGVSV